MSQYKSPAHEMSQTTPTQFWNDSCSVSEIKYALEHGAVGATTNPVIVGQVLQNELENYRSDIKRLIAENPKATEDEITWLVNEFMAVKAAKLLEPVYDKYNGKAGCISIQTNTKFYRDADRIVGQAVYFNTLAKNLMVKMPVTEAGVIAIEESTYRGVTVNATVSFTVAQAVAAAEAIEHGLIRREKEGHDISHTQPMVTIMIGRVEDWLRIIKDEQKLNLSEEAIRYSGVAVLKNAYKIFEAKGYRARLLTAAYRSPLHWTEFFGGKVSMTMPHKWVKQFVESDVKVENRMNIPVAPNLMEELLKVGEFRKAYEPDGLNLSEFTDFGATKRTLVQFLEGYDSAVAVIRDIMVNG
ncbi:hypothetical protein FACS1894219_01860 [Clostridia bacterium]|nr:hypothetical protein FACS1894219_01860 [Clostridia bacterium]